MLGDTIFIAATIIFCIACGIFVGFTFSEGKDERGQQILGKAFNVSFVFILFGFITYSLLSRYANVDLEFMRIYVTVWMAVVMTGNAVTIRVLRQRI
ncbi:hypothetical protein [Bacillus sp. DX1.1]|nr:hypothetical protein [Bacillus sp. DX1.1]